MPGGTDGRRRRRGDARRRSALRRLVGAGGLQARRDPGRARRTTSRSTSTSWSRCSRASRARRCATAASSSPRRSTRSMHYAGLSKALRGAHTPGLDPGVDGMRAAPAARASSARSCRGTSRRRCCATSSAPALVAGNTVVAKPAGHDAADDAALRRAAGRGRPARRACSTWSPAAARSPARRWCATRSCARSPSPARPRWASRSWRWPRRGMQARHARAGRLGPDDHLRRRRPAMPPRAPPRWAASTTAARRAWRSSASTCSSPSPTRSSSRSRPRPSG